MINLKIEYQYFKSYYIGTNDTRDLTLHKICVWQTRPTNSTEITEEEFNQLSSKNK